MVSISHVFLLGSSNESFLVEPYIRNPAPAEVARSSEGRRKSKEDYGAMAVQDDLESKLANSALDSSSSRLPSTRGASSDGERIGANEGSVSLGDNGAELDEKIGGADVEGNMFMNIWHEYLFIFVVTSAQLITVSFCQYSDTCDRGLIIGGME